MKLTVSAAKYSLPKAATLLPEQARPRLVKMEMKTPFAQTLPPRLFPQTPLKRPPPFQDRDDLHPPEQRQCIRRKP